MKLRKSGAALLAMSATLLFGSFAASGPEMNFGDSVIDYFQGVGKIPQEKLYLHLDKPYYGAGENIWFRGYLLNAATHTDDSPSNYIYVELVDCGDSVLQRLKFRRDSAGFRGSIPLPASLPAGDYYLRGYTTWMQNNDPAFFYRHSLRIGNSIVTDILSEMTECPTEQNGGMLRIRFFSAAGEPHTGIKVAYTISAPGKKDVKGEQTTDDQGILTIANLKSMGDKMRASVKFDDEDLDYSNSFYINNVSGDDYAVSFFPEGGNLLDGIGQQVAFKAQAATGFSLPVSGIVTNSRGDTVASFASEHNGMGVMTLTPAAGEKYTAETRSENGVVRKFELPEVNSNGFGLSMAYRSGGILYNVQKTAATTWPDTLFLIAHLRGDLRMIIPVTENKASGKLNADVLPDGIVHFLLADKGGVPISERLLFVRHPDAVAFGVATDKAQYGKRDPVRMEISLTDLEGNPADGQFSVSVTDNHTVQQDTLGDNILSSLLLTSDLKGYIENPGYYFNGGYTPAIQRHLDLVMLSHGWRRFRIENLNEPPKSDIKYYIEAGQTVAGQVKTPTGKGVPGASVVAYSADCFMMKKTDETGHFLIDSIQFSDTVSLIVQASTHKGGQNVDVIVNSESFPLSDSFPFPYRKNPTADLAKYLANTRDQYYNAGGMRVVQLKEVVVKGEQQQKDIYASMAEQNIKAEDIPKAMQNRPLIDYLGTLSGIRVVGGKLSIRGNGNEPLILVDEVPYYDNAEILSRLYTDNISSISIIKGGGTSFFGIKGGNGVISIMRKDRLAPVPGQPAPGVAFVKPLGVHPVAEFYNPVYETPEQKAATKSDLRTTIYWNPSLRFDETGKASILFYTSDDPGSYHVTIEGVTSGGYVTRYSDEMSR